MFFIIFLDAFICVQHLYHSSVNILAFTTSRLPQTQKYFGWSDIYTFDLSGSVPSILWT